MRLELRTAGGLVSLDLDIASHALRHARHVPYAPPHVFPMSAPRFTKQPRAPRPVPDNRRMGVYIHVPYCRYVCNFCFYVKQLQPDTASMRKYVEAVEKELGWLEPDTQLTQLFLGGGTPTALPPELLDRLLSNVLSRLDRGREGIHTVETSPETITPAHLDVLDRHRIGRVSMGIQSLSQSVLDTVERRHSAEQALDACRLLVSSGRMVNVDLIYGLPGQTREMFQSDMRAVANTGIHCINAYNLRVNEKTPVLERLRPEERLELGELLRWRACVERTAMELGFRQTHWQRFLRPEFNFELDLTSDNLFGAGVSARSFLGNKVYRNHPGHAAYLERTESGESPVQEVFALDAEHRKTYFVARSLGCGKPLRLRQYEQTFGQSFLDEFGEICRELREARLLDWDTQQVELAAAGRLAYDLVTLGFYPQALQSWLEERHARAMASRC